MPNVHDVAHKCQLAFWLPMELHAKFAALARDCGVPMAVMMRRMIEAETQHVRLRPEQGAELDRRKREAYVTRTDVALAAANNVLLRMADVALVRPTLTGKVINPIQELPPLPKLGARKRRR